ncbi:ATP-binding cassette domain-containing protein [Arthrobacter crusticola]|uniref:ATP-binding cassette domain-containing protein n=1 Tax=Arthrobacter crusticola TaxID=2547960 RepID=A0A4R5TSH4_9MICC|nr:ATP-binding cassette domain-containing protein [Arthrobacter crusticola]TDK23934.1 ATP-binding cassette domain-containing protein [Arthrobacter crusticola]
MIEVRNLSKAYGPKKVVDEVSFTAEPGTVTGFLGPNGAGKSTTMRLILGLDEPTAGWASVNGKPLRRHKDPLRQVGALLDAKAVQPGISAENHLLALAATHGINHGRVQEMISFVGLESVASKRVGGFSLGMHQRLGIAAALLGDPSTVVLDEPINGLDPEGVLWIRQLLRQLADEGRTVFLSSHLMSEMAQTADHLIVIGRGKILASDTLASILTLNRTQNLVMVRSDELDRLCDVVLAEGANVRMTSEDGMEVDKLPAREIARIAGLHNIALDELRPLRPTLEQAYLNLTAHESEYSSSTYTHEKG